MCEAGVIVELGMGYVVECGVYMVGCDVYDLLCCVKRCFVCVCVCVVVVVGGGGVMYGV